MKKIKTAFLLLSFKKNVNMEREREREREREEGAGKTNMNTIQKDFKS
jgi:hypothetical protein